MRIASISVAGALATVACGGGSARPVADPGGDRTVPTGVSVEFDGSASRGQISMYEWDFGDGSAKVTGVKASHAFANEGDFTAALTVRGPGGADTKTALVHVGAGCIAKAGIAVLTLDPQPGVPVNFDGSSSTGCESSAISEFHWDFGDGSTDDGDATHAKVAHAYSAKNSYQVLLRVVDGKGTEGRASRMVSVGIAPGVKPVAVCASTAQAVAGKEATFNGQGSDPGGSPITTYQWLFSDDSTTALGATVKHTYATAGSFTAKLTVGTSDGRTSDPCTTTVTVTSPPNYAGNWLLNPSSATLTGCTVFSPAFPATNLAIVQSGSTLTATPSGNGWPSGTTLSGNEEPPPAAAGSFRLRGQTSAGSQGSCSTATPDHSVSIGFGSDTQASGTWTVVYDFSCVTARTCPIACNCVGRGDFTAVKR